MKHFRIEDRQEIAEDVAPRAFVFSLAGSLLVGLSIWAGALWLLLCVRSHSRHSPALSGLIAEYRLIVLPHSSCPQYRAMQRPVSKIGKVQFTT